MANTPDRATKNTPDDSAVFAAARRLFVRRNYADITVNDVTTACGITRADFEARFTDKREMFLLAGLASLRDILDAVAELARLPEPVTHGDLADWVRRYFAVMDRHGEFIFHPALTAAAGPDFASSSRSGMTQVVWTMGTTLRSRQATPTAAPDALGLALIGMVSDSWLHARGQGLPIDEPPLIDVLATALLHVLTGPG